MTKNLSDDGIIYACGTGRQKKWARERLIMDVLYNTKEIHSTYIKFKDLNLLGKPDEEDETQLYFKFEYLFRLPKTEIDIVVIKRTGLIYLKRGDLGYGWDDVEKEVYKFIERQIKIKNVYIRTGLNCEEFLIK